MLKRTLVVATAAVALAATASAGTANGVVASASGGYGLRTNSVDVGPFTYARLRRSSYSGAELDRWGERLAKLQADGRDLYVYLRHDDDGQAPGYARQLMERLA